MLITMAVCVSNILPQSVFAAVQTKELVTVSTACDVMVQMTYDVEKPKSIVFVSPTGVRYQEGVSPSGQLEVVSDDNWTNYLIKNAELGTWQLEYDVGNSRNVNYTVYFANQSLAIQSFTVSNVTDTSAEVSFLTSYDGSGRGYNYEIYAVAGNGEDGGSKLLTSGTASSDTTITKNVSLSSLTSFGAYKLRLDVFANNGDIEVFDSAESSEFAFVNPNAAPPISGADITVDTENMAITINWSSYFNSYNVFVSVFADDAAEPFAYEDASTLGTRELTFDYLEDHSKLTVYVYRRDNGVLSQPFVKDVPVIDLPVVIDAADITNKPQASITYDMVEDTDAEISLGEENVKTVRLSGKNSFAVTLSDGENLLKVKYNDNDITYITEKNIFLDRMPPQFNLHEDLDKKNVNRSDFVITGETEPGATVKIADQDVGVDDNGQFSHTVTLASGENSIEIKAIDAAGNTSSKTLTVYNGLSATLASTDTSKVTAWIPLFVTLGISVVILLLAFFFMKKKETILQAEKPDLKTRLLKLSTYALLVLGSAALIAVIYSVLRFTSLSRIVNDSILLDIAEKSPAAAYEYIELRKQYLINMIVGGVLTVLSIAGFIVIKILLKKKKGK